MVMLKSSIYTRYMYKFELNAKLRMTSGGTRGKNKSQYKPFQKCPQQCIIYIKTKFLL